MTSPADSVQATPALQEHEIPIDPIDPTPSIDPSNPIDTTSIDRDTNPRPPIKVTVVTGFLGAGKTTFLLDLLRRRRAQAPEEKVVWLKNEYGDVEVDSRLARQSSLVAVREIQNGCLCCVMVGQMRSALLEIAADHRPDRVILEASGSAFPATLAWQVRQLAPVFELDAVVTVVDVLNFPGYEDTSPTARMQAQYTDLILLAKHELATEAQLDAVLDSLHDLNDMTPKIKFHLEQGIDPDLIFGPDSRSFSHPASPPHNHEQDTNSHPHPHSETNPHPHAPPSTDAGATHDKITTARISVDGGQTVPLEAHALDAILASRFLPSDEVFRLKGFVCLSDMPVQTETGRVNISEGVMAPDAAFPSWWILNWAFGRYDLTPLLDTAQPTEKHTLSLTMMGTAYGVRKRAPKIAASFQATHCIA